MRNSQTLDSNFSGLSSAATASPPRKSPMVNFPSDVSSHVLHSVNNMQTSPVSGPPLGTTSPSCFASINNSLSSPSCVNANSTTMDMLNKTYAFFFTSFEKQWTQKLEQLTIRLDGYEREQSAMQSQLNRIENLMQTLLEQAKPDENSKRSLLSNGIASLSHPLSKLMSSNTFSNISQNISSCTTAAEDRISYSTKSELASNNPFIPAIPTPSTNIFTEPARTLPTANFTDRWSPNYPPSCARGDAPVNGITRPFSGNLFPPYLFWHQWMLSLFGTTANPSINATSTTMTVANTAGTTTTTTASPNVNLKHNPGSCPASAAVFERLQEMQFDDCPAVGQNETSSWPPRDYRRVLPLLASQRPCKLTRLRGRRVRGSTRSVWSALYAGTRAAAMRRALPYARPTREQLSASENGLTGLDPYKASGLNLITSMNSFGSINQSSIPMFTPDIQHSKVHDLLAERNRAGYIGSNNLRVQTSSNSSTTKAAVLIGNPIVILNPKEPREIFIGGIPSVPLPLWAYKKCLTMVRGEPHELGPRLCLRLLQSLFSLHYLVTHNYNGSGGKAPIDPIVMGAVLRQAQIQFGSGYFFTEPMALGKLRDYLNNAFRVMAFRQRKGERVRSPFWNEQGEPVHGLEAPVEFAETSDVIVLTNDFCSDASRANEASRSTGTPNDEELGEQKN